MSSVPETNISYRKTISSTVRCKDARGGNRFSPLTSSHRASERRPAQAGAKSSSGIRQAHALCHVHMHQLVVRVIWCPVKMLVSNDCSRGSLDSCHNALFPRHVTGRTCSHAVVKDCRVRGHSVFSHFTTMMQHDFLPEADGTLREVVHHVNDEDVPEHRARIISIEQRLHRESKEWPKTRQIAAQHALILIGFGRRILSENSQAARAKIESERTFKQIWAVRLKTFGSKPTLTKRVQPE